MKTITYRGVRLENVGLSWYAALGSGRQYLGMTLAEAKRKIDGWRPEVPA